MSQSHSDLSLSASAIETNTVSVNVKDLQINNTSLNRAANKGEKKQLSAKERRLNSAKKKENQAKEWCFLLNKKSYFNCLIVKFILYFFETQAI